MLLRISVYAVLAAFAAAVALCLPRLAQRSSGRRLATIFYTLRSLGLSMDEIDFSKLAIGSVVPGTVPIISMDFHEKGELCVTTASDSSIVLVNALEGKVRKVVRSQKYGTGTIRYTHHDQVCENVTLCCEDNASYTVLDFRVSFANRASWLAATMPRVTTQCDTSASTTTSSCARFKGTQTK
jgi:hypothetical protein